MTEQEKNEIVDAVLARINANTQAVEDLPVSGSLADFTSLPVLGSDGSMKKLRADLLKGEPGAAMTFAQLTDGQKAELKGEKGDKMTFADLTNEEKAALKGERGDDGTSVKILGTKPSASALPSSGNVAGDTYLVNGIMYVWSGMEWVDCGKIQGPKGDPGASVSTVNVSTLAAGTPATASVSSDHKTLTLGIPKGDKGDPLKYSDLTAGQKAELKGEKGDKMTFADLTAEEKASLKGADGDSGIPMVADHGTGDTAFALTPNVFHRWGSVSTLNLSIGAAAAGGRLSEYMAEFTCPSGSATALTVPDTVRWAGGTAPTLQAGRTYQLSIVNNIAIIIG